ncbi:hypothetical protein J2Z75_002138 [Rhizobium herbae]|uniref:Uncharacterized protein n=1 Tax=Rhizobium herbae TaxID=508661 RepID=A0ABS4EL29_9HYPH|nr:hypothetical protein [Rhizobium herbae]
MTLNLMRSSHAVHGMRDFSIHSARFSSLTGSEVRP